MNSILSFALTNILTYSAIMPMTGWRTVPLGLFRFVPAFTLVPRLILSLREAYARDDRGVLFKGEVDPAFGLASSRGGAVSAIVFVEDDERD